MAFGLTECAFVLLDDIASSAIGGLCETPTSKRLASED
jgi:hypothetical protein